MSSEERKRLSLSSKKKNKRQSPKPITESKTPEVELEIPEFIFESFSSDEVIEVSEVVGEKDSKSDKIISEVEDISVESNENNTKIKKLDLNVGKSFRSFKKEELEEEPEEEPNEEPEEEVVEESVVSEEVLQTPTDRLMGALDNQLSAMGRLAKGEDEVERSLVEQKMDLLEKQMSDMRRLILETSQSTIVNGLGAGSPGSGEVKLSKLDDVDVTGLENGNALIYNTTTSRFEASPVSNGGYEFTGGFSDRDSGQSGANDLGSFVAYPQTFVDEQRWYRFGFSQAAQTANDNEYWGESDPDFDQTKGLFGGLHMPSGVTDLFDFSYDDGTGGYSEASDGSLKYNAATGSIDFRQARVGDLALVRFDFNVIPQVANTTLEVAMIWATRDANDNITFTFPLTGSPLFYGTGTVGRTFLTRPLLTAYFASQEDVNARALLAIRADNPIQIAPLTTLVTLQR